MAVIGSSFRFRGHTHPIISLCGSNNALVYDCQCTPRLVHGLYWPRIERAGVGEPLGTGAHMSSSSYAHNAVPAVSTTLTTPISLKHPVQVYRISHDAIFLSYVISLLSLSYLRRIASP